jgi:hypothetical protein
VDWAPVAIGVSVFGLLINFAVGAVVALITHKARADDAVLKNDLQQLIRTELRDYVGKQQFNDFEKGHDVIHAGIQDFMDRHRDWKHDVEPILRGLQMNVEDLKTAVGELKNTSSMKGNIDALATGIAELRGVVAAAVRPENVAAAVRPENVAAARPEKPM